ncbi:redoxin domain-containing protein [Pendulispora rubella]|uniref:Redoxin domain-containing protein n=1 Tax=Pendulispora rubella TaxID=2741070 RepID=A0ABZ2L0W5_9BACT
MDDMMEQNGQLPVHETEVAIIGAGILGLTNALAYAKRGIKVTLIDDIVNQKRSFKVGESLLIFSNPFLRAIGGLDDFIHGSFPKDGVWFNYGMEGKESFDDVTEWAFQSKIPQRWQDAVIDKKLFRAMFYDAQIVRPEAEDLMREQVRANPNIRFLDSVKVKNFTIADDDGSQHVLDWECGTTKNLGTVKARWLLDCSGRVRLLAKTLNHAMEERVMDDGFQTTAVWAQLDGIEDELFGEPWVFEFQDGKKAVRDRNTAHLWGDGYWIWVIRLTDKRISIGATFDQRKPPPGKTAKDQFWNLINRYPLLTRALKEENVLEFRYYKNVQYMTDTFVSHRRYGMVGDAGSIIDAYYSQGVSLSLVTSWHIQNIVQQDLRESSLDRTYIDRVNEATRQDWFMMRSMVKEKYTEAIKDPRFFILSHLLDLTVFSCIIVQRWKLVRWLVETDCNTDNENDYHRRSRERLKKTLFYSRTPPWGLLGPERVQKLQRRFQEGLGARARWRLENGVELAGIKSIVRVNAGMPNLFKTIFGKAKEMIDASPDEVIEPEFMRITGKEEAPLPMRLGGPTMLMLFLSMYGYDWAETEVRKAVHKLRGGKAMKSMEPQPMMPRTAPSASALHYGDRMPDVMLQADDGKNVRLSDYWSEKPTAFVFIRHFGCPHCRVELVRLNRARAQIEQAGGRVVAISMGDVAKAAEFKKALKLDFPVLADPSEKAYEACNILLQPNTLKDNLGSFRTDAPLFAAMMAKGEYGKFVFGGNDLRLGGTVIADREGRVGYVYRATQSSGAAPFDDLLKTFGQLGRGGRPMVNGMNAAADPVTLMDQTAPAVG